jgi:hypothetical protein
MTFEFKIKNTKIQLYSVLYQKENMNLLYVLNLNSKVMSKPIFPNFYSLEAPSVPRSA